MRKGTIFVALPLAAGALLFGALLVSQLATAQPDAAAPPTDPNVLVKVNGKPITRDELYKAMLAKYGEEELNDLVNRMLVAQERARLGVVVTPAEVDKKMQQLLDVAVERFKQNLLRQYSGMIKFEDYLTQMNMTLEQFREEQRKSYEARIPNLRELLAEDVVVEKLVRFYELSHEHVRVAHILLLAEEEAKGALKKLAEGGDFAEIAKKESLDAASKEAGGEIELPIYRDDYRFRTDYPGPEFEKAALALRKEGEYSQPVKTDKGWDVIKLIERHDARPGSYRDLEAEVSASLAQKPINVNDQQIYLAHLMVGAKIENFTGLKINALEFLKGLESKGAPGAPQP